MGWLVLTAAVAGVGLAVAGDVPAPYAFGPLVALVIWRVGTASVRSLRDPPPQEPGGEQPTSVDLEAERVTYRCGECGTEVLLIVRGGSAPPRHCGQRMARRRIVAAAGGGWQDLD